MSKPKSDKTVCSKCGERPRHPNHSWCVECRREDARERAAKKREDLEYVEMVKERRKTPEYREVSNKYQRERYANDPEYREKKLEAAAWTPERKEARKERYQNDEEYRENNKAKSRSYRVRLRKQVYEAYGNRCACPGCDETNELFLSVDHINNDGSEHRKSLRGTDNLTMMRDIRDQGFPQDKYQLLCFNCNMGKERNGGICPHLEESV